MYYPFVDGKEAIMFIGDKIKIYMRINTDDLGFQIYKLETDGTFGDGTDYGGMCLVLQDINSSKRGRCWGKGYASTEDFNKFERKEIGWSKEYVEKFTMGFKWEMV